MKKLCVLLPSYGRPKKMKLAIESYKNNSTKYSDLKFGFSAYDEFLHQNIMTFKEQGFDLSNDLWIYGNLGFCRTVNCMVEDFKGYDAYMILNDDQIIHTKNFDKIMMDKLDELEKNSGHRLWILHWRDDIHNEKLCQSFATKEMLEAIGTYYPDGYMRHLYSDNMYHIIGDICDNLCYLKDVYIEHNHFCVKKAKVDKTYEMSNSQQRYNIDGQQLGKWLQEKCFDTCKNALIKMNKWNKKYEYDINKKIKSLLKNPK